MRSNSGFYVLAAILIVSGALFLLENFGVISGVWLFWPLLPLIIGTGFGMLFFRSKKRDPILLGLSSFILLNSIFFFFLNFTSWMLLEYLWPIFIILLGITFLAGYFSSRKRVLLYLGVLLTALGASFILVFAIATILWPTTLVLAGISFIIIGLVEHFGRKK